MKPDLQQFLTPQQATCELGGVTLTVKELPSAADIMAFHDGQDHTFKLLVRCVFLPDGNQAFTDDDIPVLKAAPRMKFWPLMLKVQEVNGQSVERDQGNSEAVPSSG
jgi:hypothetical protein